MRLRAMLLSGQYTYRLTRREALRGAANRFVHSRAYLWLYAGMALASLVAAFLSFGGASHLDCAPSPDGHPPRRNGRAVAFFVLEGSINVLLICEVALRLAAFGRGFWASRLNIVDLALVVLCIVTLIVLGVHHACPSAATQHPPPRDAADSEERIDSLLLIVRNIVQALRLVAVVRRSQASAQARRRNTVLLGHDPARSSTPSSGWHGSGWSTHYPAPAPAPAPAHGRSPSRVVSSYPPFPTGQSREALLGSLQNSPVSTPRVRSPAPPAPPSSLPLLDLHHDEEDL